MWTACEPRHRSCCSTLELITVIGPGDDFGSKDFVLFEQDKDLVLRAEFLFYGLRLSGHSGTILSLEGLLTLKAWGREQDSDRWLDGHFRSIVS